VGGRYLATLLKYKAIAFYIGTVLLSGLFLLLQTFVFPNSRLILMQLAPGFITIIMVKATSEEMGLISFLKQCVRKKVAWRWIILSAIIPAVMVFGCDFTFRVLAKQNFDSYGNSAVPWSVWFVIAVMIGCIGEEIGWRGYLLPLLSKKFSLLLSSVLIGTMWGIWHFQFGEGLGFALFIVTTIEMSIIMTWLYYKGNESLITAVIFHIVINYCSQYLHGNVFDTYLRLLQALMFGILAAIIYFASPVFKSK